MNKITWRDKIIEWYNGKPLQYPSELKKKNGFFYYSTCCDRNLENEYQESFDTNWASWWALPKNQDFSKFNEFINNSSNLYSVGFFSKRTKKNSRSSFLIIPKPLNNNFSNYAHLKLFIDTAPIQQQIELWRYVAECIIYLFYYNPDINVIFVSTHGLDVPFLHIRLECFPKHFGDSHLHKLCLNYDKKCNFNTDLLPIIIDN